MTKMRYTVVVTEENGEKKIILKTNDLRLAYLVEGQNENAEVQYN